MSRDPGKPRKRVVFGWVILLIAVPFILYSHTRGYPFVFDDTWNIVTNKRIHMEALNPETFKEALTGHHTQTQRPVTNLSFALNHLFSGLSTAAFRLTNIGLHALNVLVVYGLLILILRKLQMASWLAGIGALLWAVHPVQSQAVILVHQRSVLLATLFYLLAVLCYFSGRASPSGTARKAGWFFGCAVSGGLAACSKEIAGTLPAALFLIEWYFFQQLDRRWFLRSLRFVLPVVLLAGAALYAYLQLPASGWLKGSYRLNPEIYDPGIRLMTQARVVVRYIGLLFCPHPSLLNLDHYISFSKSLLSPLSTLGAGLLIALLGALAVYAGRRKWLLLSLGITWFFLNLVIESTLIPLEQMYEHRVYLPFFGFVLIVTWAVSAATRVFPRPTLPITLAVLCLLSFWTGQRSRAWSSDLALWEDCVSKSPQKSRTWYGAAKARFDAGDRAGAIQAYRKAIEINPSHSTYHYYLGIVYFSEEDYTRALVAFDNVLKLEPGHDKAKRFSSSALLSLGNDAVQQGALKKAVAYYQQALQITPGNDVARKNLGIVQQALNEQN